ncbi:MAG: glycosyltransferase, partial [Pseudonocardiaceae bacterium]
MTAGNAPTSQPTAPAVPDLEVIVPALNEQGRIESTLGALADHLSTLDLESKVRVIDNGSTDRTPDIVDRVNSAHEVDITVEGCSRPGKGSAVARGMLTSQSRWVGFCDADLATPADAIGEAVDCLEEGWPVVIGSRHV